jgi:hypothetical protein
MIAIAITAGFVAAFAIAVAAIAITVARYAPLARAIGAELAATPVRRGFAFTVTSPDYRPATAQVVTLPARRRPARQPDWRAAA